MRSIRNRNEPRSIPRTVATCERYLDRLALVLERAGDNRAAFLPLVRRLERELAEAHAEEQMMEKMRARLARNRRGLGLDRAL